MDNKQEQLQPGGALPSETQGTAEGKEIDVLGKIIWVAEDEDALRKLDARILAISGFTKVRTFSNGSEVLDAYQNTPENEWPDLIATDLDMPVVGGQQMIGKIRDTDNRKPPLFVVKSGQITPERLNELRAMGVKQIIQKPYSIKDFAETIIQVLVENVQENKSSII